MSAPYYVSWNYTYSCNFNCTHCYSRAPWYPEELSTDAYYGIASSLADAGVFRVALGGGEPLIRRDSIDVLTILASRGVETNLTTNGWFITKEKIQALQQSGLRRLYVSVDSSDPLQHDNFRRKPGSFERATEAARLAACAGLSVYFSTVITRHNASQLAAIVELASGLGVTGIEFKRFRPVGNGKEFANDYRVDPVECDSLIASFRRVKSASMIELMLVNGPETNIADKDSEGCMCGVRSICIRPNGDVSPCAYSDVVIGNLLTASLQELWAHSTHLAAIRSGGGCQALIPKSNPLNPAANIYSSRQEALVKIQHSNY